MFFLDGKIIVKKILLRSKLPTNFGTNDAFKVEVCGLNDKCCRFDIKEKSLRAWPIKGNNILELTSESLGGCNDFPIDSKLQSVSMKKHGRGFWDGDYIAIETSSEARLCIIIGLRLDGNKGFYNNCTLMVGPITGKLACQNILPHLRIRNWL